jgi:hypothetical protein
MIITYNIIKIIEETKKENLNIVFENMSNNARMEVTPVYNRKKDIANSN